MAVLFAFLLSGSYAFLLYYYFDNYDDDFLVESLAALESEMTVLTHIEEMRGTENLLLYLENSNTGESSFLVKVYNSDGLELLHTEGFEEPLSIENYFNFPDFIEIPGANGKRLLFASGRRTPGNSFIILARDITELKAKRVRLQMVMAVIFVLIMAVILVSFFISNFVVRRINLIGNTAREIIETGDLSRRISIDNDWDDLSNLSRILNGMIQNIERHIDAVKNVSDNIAHDLRTPLTRLKNKLEDAANTKGEVDYHSLIHEADLILHAFNSILRIAKIEQTGVKIGFSKVELKDLLNDLIEYYQPLAEEKDIRLQFDFVKTKKVEADRDMIFQLFANLLDNAIKFSPESCTVRVLLDEIAGKPCVKISDNGPGVDEGELEKIFQRFYRTDKSRNTEGIGLGLSLVKAVADLHDINIHVESNSPGLSITVGFQVTAG